MHLVAGNHAVKRDPAREPQCPHHMLKGLSFRPVAVDVETPSRGRQLATRPHEQVDPLAADQLAS